MPASAEEAPVMVSLLVSLPTGLVAFRVQIVVQIGPGGGHREGAVAAGGDGGGRGRSLEMAGAVTAIS